LFDHDLFRNPASDRVEDKSPIGVEDKLFGIML